MPTQGLQLDVYGETVARRFEGGRLSPVAQSGLVASKGGGEIRKGAHHPRTGPEGVLVGDQSNQIVLI
jgi:hypothetical protein